MSQVPAYRRDSEPSTYLRRNRRRSQPYGNTVTARPFIDLNRTGDRFALGILALVIIGIILIVVTNTPPARNITVPQGGSLISAGATFEEAMVAAEELSLPIRLRSLDGRVNRLVDTTEARRYANRTSEYLVRVEVQPGLFTRPAGYGKHWRYEPARR